MEEKELKTLFELAYLPFYKQQLEYTLKPMQEAFEDVGEKDLVFAEAVSNMVDSLSTEEGMYKVFVTQSCHMLTFLTRLNRSHCYPMSKGLLCFKRSNQQE